MELEVDVDIKQTVTVKVELDDVIEQLNDLPMAKRWNYVAQILNSIHLYRSDLTDEQKELCRNFLNEKLKVLE